MTIDLMALAKKADEAYLDVETSFGVLRVYHVPDAMLLSFGSDKPEPELPTVRMKTATGFQNRAAKSGDPEYTQYLKERAEYDQESFALRVAAGAVNALRDIDWSKYDLSGPPPIEAAQEMYKNKWPDNILLRKKAWLDWTILLKRADQTAILDAMNEMNGEAEPTDDMVDEVKKSSVSTSAPNQSG
jgi:hypothetical protein